MVTVEQITIDIDVPQRIVNVVTMQPFVKLSHDEPFRWLDGDVGLQLGSIRRTLELAQKGLEGDSAKFTLLPEYSVPGIPGVTVINETVKSPSWPSESVIIAGIQGLDKDEYTTLCNFPDIRYSEPNSPDSVSDYEWVNCCVIWVKDRTGNIQKWIQPKIRASWGEENTSNTSMFGGSTIYVFEAKYSSSGFPCRFATFVCFDWVAVNENETVCHEVLHGLQEQNGITITPLDWVFVIQHNDKPNHGKFLDATRAFLEDTKNTFPYVETEKSVVIHANTSAAQEPLRSGPGAFSACVFSPSAQFDLRGCRPTVCMDPVSLRGSDALKQCKDVVFREMGQCIHRFSVCVPRWVIPNATNRSHPLRFAEVHPCYDSNEPRLNGGPVPAAVKWLNDAIDTVAPFNALNSCPLGDSAESAMRTVIFEMRDFDGPTCVNCIDWADCSHGREHRIIMADRDKNVDHWGELESNGLEHVVHSLTSLSLTFELDSTNTSSHAMLKRESDFVQIIAIRGESHEDCAKHYDLIFETNLNDPVLVVTRDRDNFPPTDRELRKFTDPDDSFDPTYIDYQTLVTHCRNADDEENLRTILDDILPGPQKYYQ